MFCKKCGKEIRFVKMESGKYMPIDIEPIEYVTGESGKDRLVILLKRETPQGEETIGRVISCKIGKNIETTPSFGFNSHFATCPAADSFRKLENKK